MTEYEEAWFQYLYKKPIWKLTITENLSTYIFDKVPNRFQRWMAKVLLGWEYTEIKDEAN